MKIVIVKVIISVMKSLMAFIYFFMKLIPVKGDKIVFCSRQSDDIPLDFLLLQQEIKRIKSQVRIVIICKRFSLSIKGILNFSVATFKSMFHMATGTVCIIDSYWPAVSILNHKKKLKIIQMWHSIGKVKKSGYQSLDSVSGRNSKYAAMLNMHRNYDYVIGGARIWNPYYSKAFGIAEEKILNLGLPRIDYLLNTCYESREKLIKEFPQFTGKKIVLYAPTFRKNMKSRWEEMITAGKSDKIAVIIRNHPGQCIEEKEFVSAKYNAVGWKTIDLLAACDWLITDYSSIALEAAAIGKKTFFWLYDYDEYIKNSGINIDLKKELSSNISEDIEKIMFCIENDIYDYKQQERYIRKYIPKIKGESTKKIAAFVADLFENNIQNKSRCQYSLNGCYREKEWDT